MLPESSMQSEHRHKAANHSAIFPWPDVGENIPLVFDFPAKNLDRIMRKPQLSPDGGTWQNSSCNLQMRQGQEELRKD